MANRLFLLDGMALIYRAHFAFIRNPITTADGQNTSAIFGFCNTLLDILKRQKPTHIALAVDTSDPTERHQVFPDYKANRDAMPEDIQFAIPHVYRLAKEAFNIPVLRYPGYEADDVIGTYARLADEEGGFETFMVTPDKDFAQLVSKTVWQYKPGRQGSGYEIVGPDEVCEAWNVPSPDRVADILGLWGDASDNIPGVPGIGEKTAKKLIGEYGSIENLLEHAEADLKGKQREKLLDNREQALLSKQLATINRAVPVTETFEELAVQERNDEVLKEMLVEFEFNQIGKRLFGDEFQSGRGHQNRPQSLGGGKPSVQGELFGAELKTQRDVEHRYELVDSLEEAAALIERLGERDAVCFDLETTGLDARRAEILGIAFSVDPHAGWFVRFPEGEEAAWLEVLRPFFEDTGLLKIGHNLKYDLTVLRWHGMRVVRPMFDTLIAHFLVDPGADHGMDFLSERYLGYSPLPIAALIGEKKGPQKSMREVPVEQLVEYAVEDSDVTLQLKAILEKELGEMGQNEVFYEVEMPLMRVLVEMEYEGIALDTGVLKDFSGQLETQIAQLEKEIYELAGEEFNLNSPKQLGEVLFERLKLVEKPKKTATGQYATNEQVLMGLATKHPVVQKLLEYREASKLKNTYVDALPACVFEKSGRVHTHFMQTGAATGRLASSNPNLQNIPIRSEQGQEIRKAFVPRSPEFRLLAADYSQIELRIMAEMSGDPALREAFDGGLDIHAATAARVYGVALDAVEPDMRRKAKMVNFGIIYGISAFGLAQRLGIAQKEARQLIAQYFKEYPEVKAFMDATVAFCREQGYVQTLAGRRRYIRDITSRNAPTRNGAERTAINSPIQGTAADMIKLAMTRTQRGIEQQGLQSRMLLQVHDELVFDMHRDEEPALRALVEEAMKLALPLEVPIVVDIGVGDTWLEAH